MGKVVPTSVQRSAAEDMATAISSIEGVSAEVSERKSGTSPRSVVSVECLPGSWRNLAVCLCDEHDVDYCSMITGIHWPDGSPEKNWEVVYHFLRMAINDPPVTDGMIEPIIVDPTTVSGKQVPLEIEVSVPIPETREPSVPTVQDIWIGADWNE